MTSRPQCFLDLSVRLTGFSPVRLLGTGMAETYLAELDAIVPARLLDRILRDNAPAGPALDADHIAAMLDDPDIGPVVRNITILWYCGMWTALPDAWRERNGAAATDATRVVSSAAYQSGLQWAVVGAHPAGARQQGFGAWSTEPADLAS